MTAATSRSRKTAGKSARRKSASRKKTTRKTGSSGDAPKKRTTLKKRMDRLAGDMVKRGIRLEEALEQLEKCFLQRVLADEGGNQTRAAARLQVHRNTLRRKMERHGLQ